jgi:S-(hydroxymethyl)mycothiol dehydrogenase
MREAVGAGGDGSIVARGVIAREPGKPGVVEEFTIDAPGPGEALVRILASGVCHTDLSAKNGVFGTEWFPFLLGHEGAGVVERVGEGVTNVAPGDHVILAWRAPCGACRFCLVGQPHLCAASLNAEKRMRTMDGKTLTPILGIGTFCTHTLVHSKQCVPYDPALPPEQMSLLGCGVTTGVGAALNSADVKPGTSVAVFGCGGVGNSVIMGAKLAGATTIIGVDIDPRKLEWAREFGATHTVMGSTTPSRPSGAPTRSSKRSSAGISPAPALSSGCADPRRPSSSRWPNSSISGATSASPGMAIACLRGISHSWPTGTSRASSIWIGW